MIATCISLLQNLTGKTTTAIERLFGTPWLLYEEGMVLSTVQRRESKILRGIYIPELVCAWAQILVESKIIIGGYVQLVKFASRSID